MVPKRRGVISLSSKTGGILTKISGLVDYNHGATKAVKKGLGKY